MKVTLVLQTNIDKIQQLRQSKIENFTSAILDSKLLYKKSHNNFRAFNILGNIKSNNIILSSTSIFSISLIIF